MELTEGLNSKELTDMVISLRGKDIREIKKEIKVNISGKIAMLMIYLSGIRESYTSRSLGMLVVFDDLTDIIKAQKVITWQEVARRLAHEIKNPLTPIKLSTERLIKKWQQKDADFDDVFERSTKTIISEVESLRGLVDVFSRYGRMPEANKTTANLAELIDAATSLYKGFKDIQIKVDIQKDMPLVNIDTEQFKRALINIIDNAVKAMNNEGTVDISVKINENNVIIDIADTGPGIEDEEKEKLFIPYFSRRKDGTGLGLAIANKIVNDHGGRILVKDNKPQGSIFSVEIPIG
jgi:two-component system nitrogen regulation sensor histidine kinase NtrY